MTKELLERKKLSTLISDHAVEALSRKESDEDIDGFFSFFNLSYDKTNQIIDVNQAEQPDARCLQEILLKGFEEGPDHIGTVSSYLFQDHVMQGCKGSAGCYDRQAAEQGQQIQEDHIGNGRQQ